MDDAFPTLERHEFSLEGEDVFPSFAGFRLRTIAGPKASRADSVGRLHVRVETAPGADPSPEQHAAYAWMKANQSAVMTALLAGLAGYYRADWDDIRSAVEFDPGSLNDWMLPPPESPALMRELVMPGGLHVLRPSKDGIAYVGVESECTWDDEHGAGVLLHRDRVVNVGYADVAFDENDAEADALKG